MIPASNMIANLLPCCRCCCNNQVQLQPAPKTQHQKTTENRGQWNYSYSHPPFEPLFGPLFSLSCLVVFSHSFSSPVLTLFLVLCFLPHAQFFLTDVHPHFEPTFRLMFSISCPFFSLIAVHPQFEPIFGPLFSVSYPV
jgi:hypothetical protein